MVILGVDVAVDEAGCRLAVCSAQSTRRGIWRCCAGPRVSRCDAGRSRTATTSRATWNRILLSAGERIVRVPPKLMANARGAARTYGKRDPIDALAVARAGRARIAGRPTGRPRP